VCVCVCVCVAISVCTESLAPLVDTSLLACLVDPGGEGGGILEGVEIDLRRCSDGLAMLTLKWGCEGDGKEGGQSRQLSIHSFESMEGNGEKTHKHTCTHTYAH